jgi:hypothetical protein
MLIREISQMHSDFVRDLENLDPVSSAATFAGGAVSKPDPYLSMNTLQWIFSGLPIGAHRDERETPLRQPGPICQDRPCV